MLGRLKTSLPTQRNVMGRASSVTITKHGLVAK